MKAEEKEKFQTMREHSLETSEKPLLYIAWFRRRLFLTATRSFL